MCEASDGCLTVEILIKIVLLLLSLTGIFRSVDFGEMLSQSQSTISTDRLKIYSTLPENHKIADGCESTMGHMRQIKWNSTDNKIARKIHSQFYLLPLFISLKRTDERPSKRKQNIANYGEE